jgi:membrane-bound ClpP family serine protease
MVGISIIIILGLLLIILELLVIPGFTITGVIGTLLIVGAVFFSFRQYGAVTGIYTFLSTIVAGILLVVFAFRTKTWKMSGLSSSIDSKIENFEQEQIKAGFDGITLTRLAPSGKAKINNVVCEVTAQDEFVDENKNIVVISVNHNQVIVKSKN